MVTETLLSVGIDIGTSTTQLIFSQLVIKNMASDYAVPRIEIVDKVIVYKSRIYFTPLKTNTEIDGEALLKIIEDEYAAAGVRKEDIKTGAVIITGETSRKENAEMIVRRFAELAGDFVVATAGPDLESIIAGKGAGTDLISRERHISAVNIDIGGGTSNLALFKNGAAIDSGCLDIGGRLIKFDKDKKIVYIADKIKILIQRHGLKLWEGVTAGEEEIKKLTDIMARLLEMSVGLRQEDEDYRLMLTGHGLSERKVPEAVSFSGGVAEAIYGEKESDLFLYGDIGIFLAHSIRKSRFFNSESGTAVLEIVKPSEKIRATVVGAGSHTTKLSGSTISVDEKLLPLKNIPILKIEENEEFLPWGGINEAGLKAAVEKKLSWFDKNKTRAAIALSGLAAPSFAQVQAYARAVWEGFKKGAGHEEPLIVIAGTDMAKVLGQTIYSISSGQADLICLDGIELGAGDYIDIGMAAAFSYVVPVVVKTLVFHV